MGFVVLLDYLWGNPATLVDLDPARLRPLPRSPLSPCAWQDREPARLPLPPNLSRVRHERRECLREPLGVLLVLIRLILGPRKPNLTCPGPARAVKFIDDCDATATGRYLPARRSGPVSLMALDPGRQGNLRLGSDTKSARAAALPLAAALP